MQATGNAVETTLPSPVLRNGFEAVTRNDLECFSYTALEAAHQIRTILPALSRMSDDEELKALVAVCRVIVDGLHNDIDVIRERNEMAGVVGELERENVNG